MNTSLATTESSPITLLAGMDMKTIEPDKLEKLLEIQAKWEDREASKAFNAALVAFQSEMPPVFKGRAETTGKYKYAAYEDIMKIARPFLRKNGLAVSFSQSEDENTLTIICRVSHEQGHSEETPFTLPKDGPLKNREGKNITSMAQSQGSANSYAKRYCLCNALDIVVTGEDDDGAGGVHLVTDAQHAEICAMLDKTGGQESCDRILKWLDVPSTVDIPEARFGEVMMNLRKLEASQRKEAK